MGMNTVVLILNDFMHEFERSPKTLSFILSHPYSYDKYNMYPRLKALAEEFGEPPPHPQTLQMMPTFHNSYYQYYKAGGNAIKEIHPVKQYTRNGKKYIVFEDKS